MMLLTNKEEQVLENKNTKDSKNKIQDTKYDTKHAKFCDLGHRLTYVYWRSHIERKLGKISGLYFCPKCEKLFKMSMKEMQI